MQNAVGKIINRLVLLSFNQAAVRVVREQRRYPTGWVLDSFDNEHRDCADALRPDFLFCNKDNIDTALWPGVWKWVVYEVESLDSALDRLARGVVFIESMWPGELMAAALSGGDPR